MRKEDLVQLVSSFRKEKAGLTVGEHHVLMQIFFLLRRVSIRWFLNCIHTARLSVLNRTYLFFDIAGLSQHMQGKHEPLDHAVFS